MEYTVLRFFPIATQQSGIDVGMSFEDLLVDGEAGAAAYHDGDTFV